MKLRDFYRKNIEQLAGSSPAIPAIFIPSSKRFLRSLCRLLLRETVQRTEAPDQIHGVNAHNGPAFEQFT